MLPVNSTVWRRLPPLPVETDGRMIPDLAHAPVVDAQGGLYVVSAARHAGRALLRLPAGSERWQKVELPGAP